MMREPYRPGYRDQSGVERKTARFYVDTRDHLGRRLRMAGFTSKEATRSLGRKIEHLVACRTANEPLPADLRKWLEDAPAFVVKKLVSVDLIQPERFAGLRALYEHIEEWRAHLVASGRSEQHVRETLGRVERMFRACRFAFWSDIQPTAVEQFLTEKKSSRRKPGSAETVSVRTSNSYLQSAQQFCRWMVSRGRASEDPLRILRLRNEAVDRRVRRRDLTVEEVRHLQAVAIASKRKCYMTGRERALVYLVAVETGLRANEFRQLERRDLVLDGPLPRILIRASVGKSRKDAHVLIRPSLVAALQAHVGHMLPPARVFPKFPRTQQARMLRADLEEAGIAHVDESGRSVDFHALRHTAFTLWHRFGRNPKASQTLGRHSTIELTMDRYTHLSAPDELAVLESLPDLGPVSDAPSNSQVATGTEGMNPERHFASPFASPEATPAISTESGGSGSILIAEDSASAEASQATEDSSLTGSSRPGFGEEGWRRRPDLNWRMTDLQSEGAADATAEPPPSYARALESLCLSLCLSGEDSAELRGLIEAWRAMPAARRRLMTRRFLRGGGAS